MMHLVVSLLATSALQATRVPRASSVHMSLQKDMKNHMAAVSFAAAVAALPAASQAFVVAPELPTSTVAFAAGGLKPEGYVKPVELDDEPNLLKTGFRGLGLTTGIRSKKPAAKEFKAPASVKPFKGAIAVKAK